MLGQGESNSIMFTKKFYCVTVNIIVGFIFDGHPCIGHNLLHFSPQYSPFPIFSCHSWWKPPSCELGQEQLVSHDSLQCCGQDKAGTRQQKGAPTFWLYLPGTWTRQLIAGGRMRHADILSSLRDSPLTRNWGHKELWPRLFHLECFV